MSSEQNEPLTAEERASIMIKILRGAVTFANKNHKGMGPPSITLGDASIAANMIESQAARIAELERGEFICRSCGIRKDAAASGASNEF